MSKINSANQKIADNIELVLETLDIPYQKYGNRITLRCPVHAGDNKESCVIYKNEGFVPNWKCYTHGCHDEIGKSLFSLIKHISSFNNNECIKWVEKNLGELSEEIENRFNNNVIMLTRKIADVSTKIPRSEYLKTVDKKYDYYINQGFQKETLEKYDIGMSNDVKMHNRIIIPVFDDEYENCVGTLGRTLYEKCIICNQYHDFKKPCPTEKKYNNFSKWKNTPGFQCNSFFYNYWFAKEHIIKTRNIILVEGQADVWRCYEAGIKNQVGIFGNTLSENQLILLEKSGATKVIIFLDPDKGGEDGARSITRNCENMYDVINIKYHKEPADCSNEEINSLLGKYQ